jgi:hypothetical protein
MAATIAASASAGGVEVKGRWGAMANATARGGRGRTPLGDRGSTTLAGTLATEGGLFALPVDTELTNFSGQLLVKFF